MLRKYPYPRKGLLFIFRETGTEERPGRSYAPWEGWRKLKTQKYRCSRPLSNEKGEKKEKCKTEYRQKKTLKGKNEKHGPSEEKYSSEGGEYLKLAE
jgi:hypothetical protein